MAVSGRAVLKGVLIVVGVVALLLLLLWLAQRRLIYLPDSSQPPPASHVLPDAEDVTLTTSDGLTLGAWYIPPGTSDLGVTVLVANGNGGNRAGRAPLAAALSDAGLATLLLDYRGYGGNPGKPTEQGLARDARAAYRYLVEERDVRPERLLYFGESLGAAVVTELATEHPPAGLLLRSPFTDLAAVGQRHYPFVPVGLMLWDRYPVAEYLRDVEVATTVVYGTSDTIVPPSESRRVAAAAAGPVDQVAVQGVNHNDAALLDGPELISAVVALAERARQRE